MGLYEQIRDIAKSKGYSINRLEQELGFARSSINKFNKNKPSIAKLQQIADFLGVTVDSLTISKGNIILTYNRIKELCKTKGVTVTEAEQELGFARGSLCKIDTNKPSMEKVQKIANYFNVSVEYLMTGNDDEAKEQPQLSARDERDISRRLEQTLSDLENQQDALMFDGAPLDDETKELLKASLEHSIRVAKINAKKFTNKRYLNSENQEK